MSLATLERSAGKKMPSSLRLVQNTEIFEAPAKEGAKTRPMRIRLYSGQEVRTWWGRMIVDLSGMKLPTGQFPVLANHDREAIVGYATDADTHNGRRLEVTGQAILGAKPYETIAHNVAAGFRYQASMGFTIDRWEEIRDGDEISVNGRRFRGPGVVITQSRLKEASVVPLGADDDTDTALFADDGRGGWSPCSNHEEMTMSESSGAVKAASDPIAEFAAQQPDAVARWRAEGREEGLKAGLKAGRAEGAAQERKRLEELRTEFGEDPAFVLEQFAAGVDVSGAALAFSRKTREAMKGKDAEIQRLAAYASGGADPVRTGAAPAPGSGKKMTPEEEWAANKDGVRARFMSKEGYLAHCRLEAETAQAAGR